MWRSQRITREAGIWVIEIDLPDHVALALAVVILMDRAFAVDDIATSSKVPPMEVLLLLTDQV
jgi:hypothetical protein